MLDHLPQQRSRRQADGEARREVRAGGGRAARSPVSALLSPKGRACAGTGPRPRAGRAARVTPRAGVTDFAATARSSPSAPSPAARRCGSPSTGCVENRLSMRSPVSGLTMKSGAVAGLRSAVDHGHAAGGAAILPSAEASHSGLPAICGAGPVGGIFARAADRHLDQHRRDRRRDRGEQHANDSRADCCGCRRRRGRNWRAWRSRRRWSRRSS